MFTSSDTKAHISNMPSIPDNDLEKLSPMMMQWKQCKEKAQGALVLFRLGDFYEAFEEDAVQLSRELDLTLTKRQDTPMCGIPWHTSEVYIDRMLAKGYKIAIAEQIEDPKKAKGLVRRDIVRMISPATVMASSTLSDKRHNYFASLSYTQQTFGLALLDITTATFKVFQSADFKEILSEIYRSQPKELLISKKLYKKLSTLINEVNLLQQCLITQQEDWLFGFDHAFEALRQHFAVHSLDGYGVKDMPTAIEAAGALLVYVRDYLLTPVEHLRNISLIASDKFLYLDRATLAHLELVESRDNRSTSSLFQLLDETKTPMGARRLRQWILTPLADADKIRERQEAVSDFLSVHKHFSQEVTLFEEKLSEVRDIERLIMRIKTSCATPKDFVGLKLSLSAIPYLKPVLEKQKSALLCKLNQKVKLHQDIVDLIERSLVDNPPLRVNDGNLFKSGVHPELDELKSLRRDSKEWMANYQNHLKEITGIKTLKIGYNRMFGYYIEVSRGQADKVPATFQRRQTLVNAERFIAPELKEYEDKVLHADEKIAEIETELFLELGKSLLPTLESVLETADALSEIDCLHSLACVAIKYNYARPLVDNSQVLEIIKGRHPIIESISSSQFTANDTHLDNDHNSLMLITGPNMAGKSTYIRQVALITIMAQMGSYVPAEKARIGIIDKLFTRIGASDDLARGQSTFMVEMTETANILHQVTDRSLVILDEIGRGTSTFDGVSIAWAVAEYLLNVPGKRAKTLFATHYFELTELEHSIKGAVNYTVAIAETHSGIVFLHQIVKGSCDRSYGIHVAKIAGLPNEVIQRAEKLLKTLEGSKDKDTFLDPLKQNSLDTPKKTSENETSPAFSPSLIEIHSIPNGAQLPHEQSILNQIKSSDIDYMSPIEALLKLSEWKKQLHSLSPVKSKRNSGKDKTTGQIQETLF